VSRETHELPGERGQSFGLAVTVPDLEGTRLAFDIAGVSQPQSECLDERCRAGGGIREE